MPVNDLHKVSQKTEILQVFSNVKIKNRIHNYFFVRIHSYVEYRSTKKLHWNGK